MPFVLACQLVDYDLSDPLEAKMAIELKVYLGSIEAVCEHCHRPVWVGPRQQEHLDDATVLCMPCSVRSEEGPATIVNLGNPEGGLFGGGLFPRQG